jgi:hypothetical protein
LARSNSGIHTRLRTFALLSGVPTGFGLEPAEAKAFEHHVRSMRKYGFSTYRYTADQSSA